MAEPKIYPSISQLQLKPPPPKPPPPPKSPPQPLPKLSPPIATFGLLTRQKHLPIQKVHVMNMDIPDVEIVTTGCFMGCRLC
jgi:hypothetical protein